MISRDNYTLSIIPGTNIILDRSKGSWKKETADTFCEDFKEIAGKLVQSGQKWAKLCDLSQWKTSTPEAVEALQEHLRWSGENGMAFAAFIMPLALERMQQQRIVRGGPLEGKVEYFETEEEARDWLLENMEQ